MILNINIYQLHVCVDTEWFLGLIKRISFRRPHMLYGSLAPAKGYLPKYFSSNWSFAKFTVAEPRCICAFAPDNTSIVGVPGKSSFCFLEGRGGLWA